MILIGPGNRPPSIFFNGVIERIDAHDAWYQGICRRMLGMMKQTHPDKLVNKNGLALTGASYRNAQRALQAFRLAQSEWYAQRNLRPPRVSLADLPAIRRSRATSGRVARINDFYADWNLKNDRKRKL